MVADSLAQTIGPLSARRSQDGRLDLQWRNVLDHDGPSQTRRFAGAHRLTRPHGLITEMVTAVSSRSGPTVRG